MPNEPHQPNRRTETSQRRPRAVDTSSSAGDVDVTSEFWGTSPDWTDGHRRPRDPLSGAHNSKRHTSSNTGMIAAIRDGMAAFKPQLRDGTGPIDRTRTHGVIDSSSARPVETPASRRRPKPVPVADDQASIAELGAGEPDYEFEPHPWEAGRRSSRSIGRQLTGSNSGSSAPRELDHTGPIAFFDREIDEYDLEGGSIGDDDFAIFADTEFTTDAGSAWSEGFGLRSSRARAVAALVVATVVAAPFLWSGNGKEQVQTADAPIVAPGGALPAAAPTTLAAAPAAPAAAQSANGGVASAGQASGSETLTTVDSSASKSAAAAGATSRAASEPAVDAVAESDSALTVAPSTTTVVTTALAQTPEPDEPAVAAPTTIAPTTVPPTTAAPTTTQPACASHYEAGPGDSWYRIADQAGISPKTLLAVNQASIDTVILPGDDICLPAGATKPAPPTTSVAPTTTDAPSTTAPAKATAASKPVSSTTAAPVATTSVPAGSPGRNATPAQVQQIIRDVFPDDAEAKALDVARLESSYSPTAYNGWCCYGIFQIYYSVHAKWLPNYGVNKAEDLYDPLINAKVALEIYRRAGNSFRPWTTA